ncbi:MAG: helix-turn-helix transcriptional regulator [Clostridia bacterium]|nr:helix-turn-helix transcriptional regulator [Clostridia bacterium]
MNNIDLTAIGVRICTLRKQKGLTQEKLAELMNVSIQMISNLERGNKAIKIDNLITISKILDVSTDYLLTGKCTNNDNAVLIKKFSALSDSDRKMIEMIIDFCISKEKNL